MHRLLLGILCIGLFTGVAWADAAPEDIADTIRKANTDLPITEVNTTDIPGIYELRVGNNVFYTEKTGSYIIAGGHIFNTKTKQDLTAARLEVINKVDWHALPLDKAIVSGNPKGREIAIFTDPDCPYCRKLEKNLEGQQQLKVYTFLFPLERLHPHAREHAAAIWCAKNPHKTLQALMIHGKVPANTGDCETPIDDIQALAQRLNIRGTPTMVASDGRKRSGATSLEALINWLDQK